MNRTKKLGTISLILVAVLIFTAVFNMTYTGVNFGGGTTVDPSKVATANSSIQKSDMNLDSIREQYLNFETVEKNTAAFDGERWVIVEMEGNTLYEEFKKSTRFNDFNEYLKSVEAQKVLASIRAKQSRFFNKLDKYGISYTFKYNYSTLSTGVAIKIDASAYNTIATMSGVKDIYYSESYAVPEYTAVENDANVYSTGIYNSEIDLDGDGEPDGDYQGQGMAVAILDTGLDRTHEAFNPTKFMERLEAADGELRYTKDDIAKLLEDEDFRAEQFGAGINDVYYNEKVPFAFDYSDDDAEVFPGYSNHGTHVAGIVAGQDDTYVVNDQGTEDKSDDETFRGVAPLAQLVICKVFTDNLFSDIIGGANDIDIVAALEDCVRLNVDVINMSLGTSAGFSDENSQDHQTAVYYSIREMGISLVCAASNDYSSGYGGGNGTNLASNPESGTVGSPSTYYSALSVASINGKKSKYLQGNNNTEQVAFITNSSDGDGNRIEFIEELYKQLAEKYGSADSDLRGGKVFDKQFGKSTLNLKYVLIGGVGRPNNYSSTIKNQLRSRAPYTKEDGTQVDVDGTIALIKRGDTSFEDKVKEAMSAGADAVIIYNNVSGTINMSLGEIKKPVPTCLITMDASAPFVDYAKSHSNIGTVQVSDSFEAGPFMSDFSSWGPVSDLTLKPEITAHGGEITSAVPGAYDVLSGTSMASPNMAGAVAVLRQYLKEQNPTFTNNQLNARVNQVLMSTATIARNEEGNPYSPRKQGAGLAGIEDAVLSEGYITVRPNEKIYTKDDSATEYSIVADENGEEWLDKTKLELLDDPTRTGKYELKFTVHNTTNETQIYVPTTYVMTETLASDNRTVAEKAYMLNDMCTIEYSGTGYANGQITVPANESVEITVTITLGDEARAYFEQELTRTVIGTDGRPTSVNYKPFANGMYVEGFVSLDNVTYDGQAGHRDGVTLGVPYLAFYGDWTAAPLFDYDIYEVSEIEANSAIDFENKLKTTALASQVIGMYHNDDYIIPLGSYLYEMDEEEDDIYPARDKITLSKYDQEGSYTVYELYAAYAGLLRNASEVKTVVTNAKTGEVVYEETLNNVGKAYSAGGGNRGAFVRYEINPSEWGWQNNDEFIFSIEGWLDYDKDHKPLNYSKELNAAQSTAKELNAAQSTAKDDEILTEWSDVRNTFEFPLTIDYECPQITDYAIRFDSYKEYGVTKYRTYLDLDVYDNQYVMAVLPCYLKKENEGKLGTYLNLLTEYPIPVYGEKGGTTKVSIDITDYYEEYVLNADINSDIALFVQVEDYAMNSEVYQINLDEDSLTYPVEEVSFVSDSKLVQVNEDNNNGDDISYPIYELTLDPFELYTLNIPSEREKDYIIQNLSWSGANDLVLVNGNEIFALGPNEGFPTTLVLYSKDDEFISGEWREHEIIYAKINVNVKDGTKGRMPVPSSLNFKPVHAGDGHVVNVDSYATVEVYPNANANPDDEEYVLQPYISPWYFEAAYKFENGKDFEFEWTTANPAIATVKDGVVTFIKEGSVNITCAAVDKTNYRYLNKSINFAVGEDYRVTNYTLYEWYGDETVEIPTDVNVLYLDEDCFKNDKTITEVVLPPLLMEIPNYAFQNCTNLKKITIPSQCAYIGPYAFDGCENLETVVFPEYVDANKDPVPGYYGSIAVGHYAFEGCTSLKNFVTGELDEKGELDLTKRSNRMTVMYDGAFLGCTGLESIDLTALRVVGSGVFAGCTGLESITTSQDTAFGPYMFYRCTKLDHIRFEGTTLPAYSFSGCEALNDFTFGEQTMLGIGAYALAGTGITDITLPAGDYVVGGGAFADSKLTEVTVPDGAKLTFTGVNPFEGCEGLTFKGEAYKFDDTDKALYSLDGTTLISAPSAGKDYKLPDSVTAIGEGALAGSAITSINLDNVTSIGAYAFAGSALTSVTWPDAVTEIPDGAFNGCEALTAVQNTHNVLKVGAHAFEGCTALGQLILTNATEVGDHAFAFITFRGREVESQVNVLKYVEAPILEKIGAYAFAGAAIEDAYYKQATSVGEWAFALSSVRGATLGALKNATYKNEHNETVTDWGSAMGDHAFYRTLSLTTVTLGAGTDEISAYAFSTFDPYYDNMTLEKAQRSRSAGDYAKLYVRQNYMNITTRARLVTVDLPTTVKRIDDYAFTGQAGLRGLELGGVTDIGESAFRLCSVLADVDLSNVVNIGAYAFFGSALKSATLTKAQVIGEYAFAGAERIMFKNTQDGQEWEDSLDYLYSRSISGGQIATLTLGALTRIGDFAFAGNKLRSVEIPATMNEATYTFIEDIYDDKGRVERSRERTEKTFGAGVFAYNPALSEITVANDGENPVFTSIEGVLYAYQYTRNDKGVSEKNGMLELLQYPCGRAGETVDSLNKYVVADNTVSIAASAFEGVNIHALDAVEFPYTLKVIGSSAFYGSTETEAGFPGITNYTFNSVQAPTLLVDDDPIINEMFKGMFATIYYEQGDSNNRNEHYYPWSIDPADGEQRIDLNGIYLTACYSNFLDYVLFANFGNSMFGFTEAAKPNIVFNIPSNGVGYDSALYQAYQSEVHYTSDKPDDTSYEFINLVKALEEKFDVAAIKNMTPEQLKSDSELSLAVKAVREAYNKITNAVQQGILEDFNGTDYYKAFIQYEEALREARNASGDESLKVTLQEVSVVSQPTKNVYQNGETFDPKGMVIRVVYSDRSELKISADTLEALAESGVSVRNASINTTGSTYRIYIDYKDAFTGETKELYFGVRMEHPSSPSDPDQPGGDDPNTPSEGTGTSGGSQLPIWAIAVIAVGAVLIAGAAVMAVLIILKKKGKGGNSAKKQEASSNDESAVDTQADDAASDASESTDEQRPQDSMDEGQPADNSADGTDAEQSEDGAGEEKPEDDAEQSEDAADETQAEDTGEYPDFKDE